MKLHDIKINTMVEGYLEAMLWTDEDMLKEFNDIDLVDFSMISKELLTQVINDCDAFYDKAEGLLNETDLPLEYIGHNFWLTRSGHGVGFWDRGLGKIGDDLTDICGEFGEVDIYLGDDGLIY